MRVMYSMNPTWRYAVKYPGSGSTIAVTPYSITSSEPTCATSSAVISSWKVTVHANATVRSTSARR